jgi:branched-chain amino acid transport system substrate-binding protein
MPRFARPVVLSVAAVAMLVAPMAASSGAGGGTDDTVRIALEAPLSGDQSTLGKGMLQGARLAARLLNADGGIDGKKVVIVPIDDAADPETGLEAANEAIESGLDGVVGPYNSGVGAETLPRYLDAGLVPIRLTSADETAGLGYTLQPMTSQIAPVAATALTQWQQAQSVAIVYDPTTLYTETVSTTLRQLLEAQDVAIAAFEPIEPGGDDYSDVVDTVDATNPDVIYLGAYYPEAGLIAEELLAAGSEAQCIADYGAYDIGYVDTAGVKAARSCPVVGVPSPNEFPDAGRYIAAFRKAFGARPGVWSPYTFDSVNVLADAATATGGFDATALKGYLDTVSGTEGWTGSITLQPGTGNREPGTVVLLETRPNGTFRVDPSWAEAVGHEG